MLEYLGLIGRVFKSLQKSYDLRAPEKKWLYGKPVPRSWNVEHLRLYYQYE